MKGRRVFFILILEVIKELADKYKCVWIWITGVWVYVGVCLDICTSIWWVTKWRASFIETLYPNMTLLLPDEIYLYWKIINREKVFVLFPPSFFVLLKYGKKEIILDTFLFFVKSLIYPQYVCQSSKCWIFPKYKYYFNTFFITFTFLH